MSKKMYWTLPAWQRNVIELEEIAAYYLLKTTSIARGIQYLQWAKEIRMAHGQQYLSYPSLAGDKAKYYRSGLYPGKEVTERSFDRRYLRLGILGTFDALVRAVGGLRTLGGLDRIHAEN